MFALRAFLQRRHRSLLIASLCAGCSTTPAAQVTGTGPLPASTCGRALAILETDYASTRVAAASLDGTTLSTELISSARGGVGLSATLSGDVVLPAQRASSGNLVLLDRYPNSVITWVAPETGAVIGQLSVATGFPSNPHDYLEVDANKAYVTRYESNAAPGAQRFDSGGDVLVVNPQTRTVVGHIPFANEDAFLPRPDRMALVADESIALALLQRFDRTFSTNGPSELVAIDTTSDKILWTLPLAAQGCGGIAVEAHRAVITCEGPLRNRKPTTEGSALVAVDVTRAGGTIALHIDASALGDVGPFGNAVAFLSDHVVLANALGDLEQNRVDRLFEVDLGATPPHPTLVLASTSAFTLGDLVCTSCTTPRRCYLADAETARVRVYALESATSARVTEQPAFTGGATTTLPPRSLSFL